MIRTCHKVIFGQVSVLVQDMGKKKKEKRGALAGCARICKIFGTVCLVAVILVCLPLTLPRVFGYEIYTVISGSMEPAIPTGSLVYIKEMEPKDVQVDDVIAFYGTKDAASIITHRVVENRVLMGEFITKGDANAAKDMNPAPYDNFIGKVAYSIPKVGGIALVLTGVYGKILAGGAILGAVILHGIASVINSKREKDEDEAEHLSEKKE